MASKIAEVNMALARTVHKDVDEFVHDHVEAGGDAHSIVGAVFMATGLRIDERTARNWVMRYAP